jgi:hypothetical protein
MTARQDTHRFNSDLVQRLKAGQLTVASLYALAAHRPLLHLCELVGGSFVDLDEVVRGITDQGHRFSAHPVPARDGDGAILTALPDWSLDFASDKLTESAVRAMATNKDLVRLCEAVGNKLLDLSMVIDATKRAHDRKHPFEEVINRGFWHRRAISPDLLSWLTYHTVRFDADERVAYQKNYTSDDCERRLLGDLAYSVVIPRMELFTRRLEMLLGFVGGIEINLPIDWSESDLGRGKGYEWKLMGLYGDEKESEKPHWNSVQGLTPSGVHNLHAGKLFMQLSDLLLYLVVLKRHPDMQFPKGDVITALHSLRFLDTGFQMRQHYCRVICKDGAVHVGEVEDARAKHTFALHSSNVSANQKK